MPQPNEIYWTWNFALTLILTIVVLPAISLMIVGSFKRQFQQQYDKNAKIAELLRDIVDGKANALAEKEEIKSEHIEEWRMELKRTQDCIKTRLDEISKKIEEKVDWEHCYENMNRFDERLRQGKK